MQLSTHPKYEDVDKFVILFSSGDVKLLRHVLLSRAYGEVNKRKLLY